MTYEKLKAAREAGKTIQINIAATGAEPLWHDLPRRYVADFKAPFEYYRIKPTEETP